MNKQVHFQSAVAAALQGRDAARDEIFERLKSLSPEERAKIPPETYARLAPEQFAILLGRPLPKMSFEQAIAAYEPVSSTPHYGSSGKSSRHHFKNGGKIRSPLHKALRLASMAWLCTGLPSVGALAAAPYLARFAPPPVRPVNVSTWPQCARLDANTDGCVYDVESVLTWPQTAQLLAMPLPTLLAANRATGDTSLAQGSPIIVWRFRHPLSQ